MKRQSFVARRHREHKAGGRKRTTTRAYKTATVVGRAPPKIGDMKAEIERSMARVVKKLAGEKHALAPDRRRALIDQEALVEELFIDLEEHGVLDDEEFATFVGHWFIEHVIAEMEDEVDGSA
jgi:hypothetical protein